MSVHSHRLFAFLFLFGLLVAARPASALPTDGIVLAWDIVDDGDYTDVALTVIGHDDLEICLAVTRWIDEMMIAEPEAVQVRAIGFDRLQLRALTPHEVSDLMADAAATLAGLEVRWVTRHRPRDLVVPPRHTRELSGPLVVMQTLNDAFREFWISAHVPNVHGLSEFQQAYFDSVLLPQLLLDRPMFDSLGHELQNLAAGSLVPDAAELSFSRDEFWQQIELTLGVPRDLLLARTQQRQWVMHVHEVQRSGDRVSLKISPFHVMMDDELFAPSAR